MGTAASSDLLVQASITGNTPGGNHDKTWHLCMTFLACGFAIHVQAQLVGHPLFHLQTPPHPDKLLSTQESWDSVQGITGLGEVSSRPAPMALKYFWYQTLLLVCKHLTRTVKEQNYSTVHPICKCHLTTKAFAFPGEVMAVVGSQEEKGIICEEQDSLLKAGSSNCLFFISFKNKFLNPGMNPAAVNYKNTEDKQAKPISS